MFEDCTVVMLTNDGHPLDKEMRQVCKWCNRVQYVLIADGDKSQHE